MAARLTSGARPARTNTGPDRPTGRATACPRAALVEHAGRRGESLAGLSLMLGHSRGYLDRFVRDGVPRALNKRDHQLLADHCGASDRGMGIRDLWSHG